MTEPLVPDGPAWTPRSLGVAFRPEFLEGVTPEELEARPSEFDQWATLAGAITDAAGRFTMVELGAGFGRWTVYAAAALRTSRPDVRHRLVAVEAEPTHFAWLRRHTRDHGLGRWSRGGTCRLIQAAASGSDGEEDFYVGDPARWYGQALVRPENVGADAEVRVKTIRLSHLLRRLGFVDLLDLDIQGAELEVLSEARSELRRVRRIYVETHSAAIDEALPDLFLDWTLVAAQPLGASTETPYGPAEYTEGGFQVWLNPAA